VSICSALIVPENCSGSVDAAAMLAGVVSPRSSKKALRVSNGV
jgi:hypothetical protein